MKTKSLLIPCRLTRSAQLSMGEAGPTVSISSDVPYLRYDKRDEPYYEVLDHSPGKVDTERLDSGFSLLFNHDRDAHIGRSTKYVNNGKRIILLAEGFIWAAGEFAENKRKDIESGALPDTSVGYEITGEGVRAGQQHGIPIYRFPFKPYEGSFVTIPADITVGADRQRDHSAQEETREVQIVDANELQKGFDGNNVKTHRSSTPPIMAETSEQTPSPANPPVDVKAERANAIAEHKRKCKKIDEFTDGLRNAVWKERVSKIAAKHKDGEADFDSFRTEALDACNTDIQLDTPARVEVLGDRPSAPSRRGMSIGTEFIRSQEYKERGGQTGRKRTISIDVADCTMLGIRGKASMARRAGFTSSDLAAVNIQVLPGMVTLGVQPLTIMDLLAPGTTGAAALPYIKENTLGAVDGVPVAAGQSPRAKTVGEGERKPLYTPDFVTDVANVKKVAVTTKVPDEFMADFSQAQSFIDERLPYMVDLETEYQLLYGDGIGNNLKGIFTNQFIQTRAIDPTNDTTVAKSLRKGLTDIWVGSRFMATAFGFHPYDWETAQLLTDTSGKFLAGGPYYVPYGDGLYQEINTFWGKPVVVSDAITYGKPLAGAWKLGAQYFIREGMRLEMTNSNEDDFMNNLIAVRAEHRLALATYRPPAFLEFTGFPARV